MTIILFTTRAPHPLTDELMKGFTVYEALAISEVFALAQEHPEAQIIITAGVDARRAMVIQRHYPTISMRQDIPC